MRPGRVDWWFVAILLAWGVVLFWAMYGTIVVKALTGNP